MKSPEISPKYFIPDYTELTNDKRLDVRLEQLSKSGVSIFDGTNLLSP
ncbi:hypothetical protein [Gelidibacter japonicus]|nr:hypothetical protein [Gelidibacter japonicus]